MEEGIMGSNMTCVQNETGDRRVMVEPDGKIYHEKQSRELCALHALNNLCQDRTFTKRDLDNICYKLSPDAYVNPHKSMFGLGNYDVNVIMAALQTKNLDTVWFDKRKDINGLVLENIQGLILNIPMDYKWGILHLPLRRKHWIVIRQIGASNFYNLDSKLEGPEVIGPAAELRKWLQEQMLCKEKELLLVVDPLVSASTSWWRPPVSGRGTNSEQNGRPVSTVSDKRKSKSAAEEDPELELMIDTHLVSPEKVEKSEHVKKYQKDYVPIEIHRTYHKRQSTCSTGSKDKDETITTTDLHADLAPGKVEAKKTPSPNPPKLHSHNEENDSLCDNDTLYSIDDKDISNNRTRDNNIKPTKTGTDSNASVVIVKQAAESS